MDYCSEVSPNIVATSVFLNEDINEYLKVSEDLNRMFLDTKASVFKKMNEEEKLIHMYKAYFKLHRFPEEFFKSFHSYLTQDKTNY